LPFVSLASLSEAELPVIDESLDWIGLDKAVDELVLEDADLGRLVELKFFSGLNAEEIAEVMGSSVATVGRQWRFARAWLARRLGVDAQAAPGE
jgi:DNA-directed RNA polymerase specialized sigma24 family protein